MNIFILDENPELAAKYHIDKHIIKMILESAQMMSTAVRISGIDAGYKITHANHPCTIWARKSLTNWRWLGSLAYYLNQEFIFRFNKTANHKSYDVITSLPWPNLPEIGLTPFAQAMPNVYKTENPVIAYRNYYIGEKSYIFNWTKRGTPLWVCDNMNVISHKFAMGNVKDKYYLYVTLKPKNADSFDLKFPIYIKKRNNNIKYIVNVIINSGCVFYKSEIVPYLTDYKIARLVNTTYDFINSDTKYELELENIALLEMLENT